MLRTGLGSCMFRPPSFLPLNASPSPPRRRTHHVRDARHAHRGGHLHVLVDSQVVGVRREAVHHDGERHQQALGPPQQHAARRHCWRRHHGVGGVARGEGWRWGGVHVGAREREERGLRVESCRVATPRQQHMPVAGLEPPSPPLAAPGSHPGAPKQASMHRQRRQRRRLGTHLRG